MFEYGEIVRVNTFIDGVVERRVVGGVPGTVFLCNESEFQSAQRENRDPVAIGFPLADVILDDEKKKAA
jgi:hypothetical protein